MKAVLLLSLTMAVHWGMAQKAISLFNGQDLHGWHQDVPAMEDDPALESPFLVRDGMLVSLGTPMGHLLTDQVFQDYTLEFEYRFVAEPGNCGVLVHASTPRALYSMFPKSIEVQMMHGQAGDFWCIVEDLWVPDMESRRGPPEDWGITEGKERRIRRLEEDVERPLGDWNSMKIQCQGDTVQVWLNEVLVNQGYQATSRRGRVALQAEGAEVEFRKILLHPKREN